MKKLMFIVATAISASVFANIESSNIVGYTTADKTGKQYVGIGACFASVGSETGFKLGDIKLEGSSSSSDMLQVLGAANAAVTDTYFYYSAAESIADGGDGSDAGWYDQSLEVSKDGIEFNAGQGFLANFAAKGVKVTSAGQVVQGSVQIDCVGKQYVMIPNFLPRTIKLGEIVLTGSSSSSDMLQVLSADNASVSDTYFYYSVAESLADGGDGSDAGWYDQSLEVSKDDVEIEAGSALLANFAAKGVKVTFPSAL